MTKPKLLIIVGPTSSGKTSLSIKLAQDFSGEVISADSRQVYRGLDLASGKVTTGEMSNVPHHILDIAEPSSVYTADDFKRDAQEAITKIIARQRLPIIAGGTFFYIDALLGKQSLPAVPPNSALRAELEQKNVTELFALLAAQDPMRAVSIDRHNPRRLIRALEIVAALGAVPPPTPTDSPYDTLILGIDITKDTLHQNIHQRLQERLQDGLVTEIKQLVANGITYDRLEDLGLECRYVSYYLQNKLDYETMVTELEIKIHQFAKRQLTWLKRDQSIIWVKTSEYAQIAAHVSRWLNS